MGFEINTTIAAFVIGFIAGVIYGKMPKRKPIDKMQTKLEKDNWNPLTRRK